jgi:GT2 family glycosyltransferase
MTSINKTKMICVVIPVHNRIKFTRECLNSLRNQVQLADYIIVVDDGSTDGTKEMLRDEFPEVIVLRGNGTLFWTAAINIGINHALSLGTDYVLTMNNDTIASQDFVKKMAEGARQEPNALLGALDINEKTRKPYYGGEIFNWKSGRSQFLLNTLEKDEQRGLQEVSLFPARGLLIPRVVFETIGLFEEKRLPHYLADYDFTQQARKNGFKVYCNYEARLYTYPEEGGDHKIRRRKTLRNYINHLFSIRGGGNLRNFTVYAIRNCPPNDLIMALVTGYFRRLGGFWLK